MTSMASDMLGYLKAGRKLNSGGGNTRAMLWETRLTTDESAATPGGTPAKFDLDPNKPQLLVLAFPLDSINPNQLLFEVARHNFSSFVVKDFDLEQMNFGNVGLLIIKGFANMKELEHYRTVMARDKDLVLAPEVRPIMISDANFKLLLQEGRSFEEYFRFEEKAAEEGEGPLPEAEETQSDPASENAEATDNTPEAPEASEVPENTPEYPENPENTPEVPGNTPESPENTENSEK